MKNILLVTQGFPWGQSERGFLPAEFEALHQNHRLTVLAYDSGDELTEPVPENVNCLQFSWSEPLSLLHLPGQLKYQEVREDLKLAWKADKKSFPKRAAAIAAVSLRAEQILPQLRQIVIENGIELIYTYWCTQVTIAALRLKREFPFLQVVTRFHGIDLYPERKEACWQPMYPFVAEQCERLVFVSETGRQFFMDTWGSQCQPKTLVSYIGSRSMPRLPVATAADKLVIFSCSSLIPLKRVELMMDALALLPQEMQVEWHHLGDGTLRQPLEAKAQVLFGTNGHIRYTFHGHVANADLVQCYQAAGAQLFMTTSSTEGLPVSMMEAYGLGLPIVATAVGGIPEMLEDGESGLLLSPDPEPQEVADALIRFAAMSPEEKQRMSDHAYELWQGRFNAALNAQKLAASLETVSRDMQ